jgi:type IV pilus assembly protein PilA
MNAQNKSNTTIVVAVLVLAVVAVIAIAFPMWRNHRIADRVDTALKGTDAAKVAVMEAATVGGGLAQIKAGALGYNASASNNPYVARVEIADGGRITLTTRDTGATPDIRLQLTPTLENGDAHAPIRWNCSVLEGSVDALPDACHDAAATPVSAPAASASVSASRSS